MLKIYYMFMTNARNLRKKDVLIKKIFHKLSRDLLLKNNRCKNSLTIKMYNQIYIFSQCTYITPHFIPLFRFREFTSKAGLLVNIRIG